MKKIAVVLNTDELGGAERSLILQLKNQNEVEFTFFIPKLNNGFKLENFITINGFSRIEYYNYPSSIYSLSRSKMTLAARLVVDFVKIILNISKPFDFSLFDMVYLNGNKAALLFFLKNRVFKFNGKVVWHLRDYYHSNKMADAVWLFLNNLDQKDLSFVCNSHSVKMSLNSSVWKKYPAEVIYNPVGKGSPARERARKIKTIGFVSMLAPWKGVHEIVLWCKLFENELTGLGIQNVKIYGANIYKTHGGHNHYVEELEILCQKFPTKILTFEGNKEPEDIYLEIDCLIHYSLGPEPFGRVILEAFDAGIPVISTCLGGAAELVQGEITGLKVFPHDRQGLFLAVEKLAKNKERTLQIIDGGLEKSRSIQKNISLDMKKILEMEIAHG